MMPGFGRGFVRMGEEERRRGGAQLTELRWPPPTLRGNHGRPRLHLA